MPQMSDTLTVPALTKEDILKCQSKWVSLIKTITKTYQEKGNYVSATTEPRSSLCQLRQADVDLDAGIVII